MYALLTCSYGSHLYGTNTPTSDIDNKVVYLPSMEDMLVGKRLVAHKERFDASGKRITDDTAKMPNNGVETEFIPVQVFCRDFLGGQTYALELAYALVDREGAPNWLINLVRKFANKNVSAMTGFAKKQTFDYIHRGTRLNLARKLHDVLTHYIQKYGDGTRLDSTEGDFTLLELIATEVGLKTGTSENNGRTFKTLILNGRDYLCTTNLTHLRIAVSKLVDSYGGRSVDAAEKQVDPKSLMHAVRVFQQSKELLTEGVISFPRPNVKELLDIKQLVTPLEETKAKLLALEAEVLQLEADCTILPMVTDEMRADFDVWLLATLKSLYARLDPLPSSV